MGQLITEALNRQITTKVVGDSILAGVFNSVKPVDKPVEQVTTDVLTDEEVFAANELGYSPSEYRRFSRGEDVREKLKDSSHYRDRMRYEQEWKAEEAQQNLASFEREAQEVLESKRAESAEKEATEAAKEKAAEVAKEIRDKASELERLKYATENKPFPAQEKREPQPHKIISSYWDEEPTQKMIDEQGE